MEDKIVEIMIAGFSLIFAFMTIGFGITFVIMKILFGKIENLDKKFEGKFDSLSEKMHQIDTRLAVIESHQGCYIKNQKHDKEAS